MRTEINSQDMNEYLNEQNTKIMQYIGPICQHQFENLHTYVRCKANTIIDKSIAHALSTF